jgi:hypothetical protein
MSRYFLKANAQFRFGSLAVNPFTGEIIIKMTPFFDTQLFVVDRRHL